MSELIDKEYYLNQVQNSPFRYPTIENVVFNSSLINNIVSENIESIKKGRENALFRCNNTFIYPDVNSTNKSNEVSFNFNLDKISDICKSDQISLFHYHGNYPGHFSLQDQETFTSLMGSGIQDSGIAGADGLHFKTVLGTEFVIPFTKAYYDLLRKEGHTVIYPVHKITCDTFFHKPLTLQSQIKSKLSKKNMNEKVMRCEIIMGENLGKRTFLPDKAIIEDKNLNESLYPFQWFNLESIDKRTVSFGFDKKNAICILSNSPIINEKILTCFEKKTEK